MLGEQPGGASGTVTGAPSASGDDTGIEVSFRGSSRLLRVGINDIRTFIRTVRPGGTLGSEDSNGFVEGL